MNAVEKWHDIMKNPQYPLLITNREQGHTTELEWQRLPGICNIEIKQYAHPVAAEDALALRVEEFLALVRHCR